MDQLVCYMMSFLDETLNSNIISTNLYNHFHTGVVEDKLYRLDTGAEIGYMKHGAQRLRLKFFLFFDSPISPDVYKKKHIDDSTNSCPGRASLKLPKTSLMTMMRRAIVVAEDPDFCSDG
ncbi:hypothetical protein JCM33374_g2653 [Metschnikowia sp. JCM 33374]|nr:hypothetical protein JCM33374_g2653 [Metschnikowia sp. JCM 33374]